MPRPSSSYRCARRNVAKLTRRRSRKGWRSYGMALPVISHFTWSHDGSED